MINRYLRAHKEKGIEPKKALIGVLYSQLPMVALGNTVLCAANLVSYSSRLTFISLALFAGAVFSLTLLRLLNYRYFQHNQFKKHSTENHYLRLVVTSFISGVVWGLWGWHVVSNVAFSDALTMLVIQCGICAGTVSTSAASRVGLAAFVIPVLSPLVVFYAGQGSTDGTVLATVILLYLILIIGSARRAYDTLHDSVILAQKNEQLAKRLFISSNTDGLTQIANRRCFDVELERLHTEAKAARGQFGLLLFDVDWFKSYNDTKGHLAGDECLKRLASDARRFFDPTTMVARYGGEEFVVLLPHYDLMQARNEAEKFRAFVYEQHLDHEAAEPFHRVTISIGVSHFAYPSALTPCELIDQADKALYQAKRGGRNQICAVDQLPERYADVI